MVIKDYGKAAKLDNTRIISLTKISMKKKICALFNPKDYHGNMHHFCDENGESL